MARRAGRNAGIYVGTTTSAEASPLSFQNTWSMSFEVEKLDVTAFQDRTKAYVAGIADASGEFAGFYDDASNQTLDAALDGLARKFYLYPDTVNKPLQYFFGTIFPDFSANSGVAGAIEMSATWAAATEIKKNSG
jgi:hypothetical protein